MAKEKQNYEKKFYSSILNSIDRNDSHNFYNEMQNAIKSGKLEVFQKRSREQLTFDATWINQIKDYLRYVENVVRNPRIYMQAVEEITPIQRAKKLNARSIQHLSSHVQNVQEIRADGTIVPSKVLSTTFEDTFAIYENRFVMTLISKLAAFVEVRYSSILESIKSYETTNVVAKSDFKWRNYDVEASIELKVREEIVDEVSKRNQELLDDIVTIRNYTRGFMGSSFYQTMREKTRPVTPPILRTNIITKSVDYNGCLRLWLFLDSYRELGIDLNVLDKDLPFDQDFIDDVCDMIMLNYSLVASNQQDRGDKFELLPYRKRKEKSVKENRLLIASDEPDLYDKIDPNEPTISEYFFQRTKKNYKTEYTKLVKSGISYNKSFTNVYRKMLKIENGVQKEIIEDMEEHLPRTASYKEKRHAKYLYLRRKKALYQSLIDVKEQDLEKIKTLLNKSDDELAKFKNEEKAYDAEIRNKRALELREKKLDEMVKNGELSEEEAEIYRQNPKKRLKTNSKNDEEPKKRKPAKKKAVEPKKEILEVKEDNPKAKPFEEDVKAEETKVKTQRDILLERLSLARRKKHSAEKVVQSPDKFRPIGGEFVPFKEEDPSVTPFENDVKEEVEKVKTQREILMERLELARQKKHSAEQRVPSEKESTKEN